MKHTHSYIIAAAALIGAVAAFFSLSAVADTVAVPEFRLRQQASLWDALPQPIFSDTIIPMQKAGIKQGGIIYRTRLADNVAKGSTLRIENPEGLALLFSDGMPFGKINGYAGENSIALPALDQGSIIEIYIDAAVAAPIEGGATKNISYTTPSGQTIAMLDWRIIPMTLDYTFAAGREYSTDALPEGPAFYKGSFYLDAPASTHLFIGKLGRGIIWINGQKAGCYDTETPEKTLLLEEAHTKAGDNEIIVFDNFGPSSMNLSGMERPISGNLTSAQNRVPTLNPDMIVAEGTIASTGTWQDADLAFPVESRYVAVEISGSASSLSAVKVIGPGINNISREKWRIESVSSAAAGYDASSVIDTDDSTSWRPDGQDGFIIIDMGSPCSFMSVSLLSSAGTNFRIYAL